MDINFFAGMFRRKLAVERRYNFPPRLVTVFFSLPCKTRKLHVFTEILCDAVPTTTLEMTLITT